VRPRALRVLGQPAHHGRRPARWMVFRGVAEICQRAAQGHTGAPEPVPDRRPRAGAEAAAGRCPPHAARRAAGRGRDHLPGRLTSASVDGEHERLQEARDGVAWRRWGPYLAERQWGTVREDYSENGDAWSSFTHDQARSRAYRWGEDGIAGISDDQQRLCL